MAAGLASAGVDVLLLGVLPTPAVAFLTADLGADLGVVISASHNAMPDNGIKIFAAGGLQARGRRRGRHRAPDGSARRRCPPAKASAGSGRPSTPTAATSTTCWWPPRTRWAGCGSSSTAPTAPPPSWRPRCTGGPAPRSIVIGGSPDGLNINAGVGSTYLSGLRAAVIAERRRPGHRPRRRRRPVPGGRRGRLGCRRRRHPGAAGDRRCRTAAGWPHDTVVGHRDGQHRLPPGHGRGRHHRADHRGR